MKKILLASLVLLMSGCSLQQSPVLNTTDITDVDFSNIENFSEGEDCAYYILGLIGPLGDVELVEAVKDAEISKVNVVDYSSSSRILWTSSCVKVYGE